MSPTSRSSRIVEGLVHGAPASVLFLAFSLGFNARVSTSQVGFALRNPLELEQGQGSDSVVGQSQQSERGASPANAPKPVLTDGTGCATYKWKLSRPAFVPIVLKAIVEMRAA